MSRVIVLHAPSPGHGTPEWERGLLQRLPYARRLELESRDPESRRASLGGTVLLFEAAGRLGFGDVEAGKLRFPEDAKPRVTGGPFFSISHTAQRVACAASRECDIGLDHEDYAGEEAPARLRRWTAVEATLKAAGAGLRRMRRRRSRRGAQAFAAGRRRVSPGAARPGTRYRRLSGGELPTGHDRDSATRRHRSVSEEETAPEERELRNTLYRRLTRGQRKLTRGRMLVYRIAVFVGWGLLRFFWNTCRLMPVAGLDVARETLRVHRSVIPVYWHQHIVFGIQTLRLLEPYGLTPGFLITPRSTVQHRRCSPAGSAATSSAARRPTPVRGRFATSTRRSSSNRSRQRSRPTALAGRCMNSSRARSCSHNSPASPSCRSRYPHRARCGSRPGIASSFRCRSAGSDLDRRSRHRAARTRPRRTRRAAEEARRDAALAQASGYAALGKRAG